MSAGPSTTLRSLLIVLLLGWCWVVGSTLFVLTPVASVNEFRQTISRLTWTPQIPTSGDEAVRLAVGMQVAAGGGFVVPDVLQNAPATVQLPGRQGGSAARLEPRFSPVYGLLLGGLTALTARLTGTDPGALQTASDAMDQLLLYRVLAIVPNLLAISLLAWFFGQSIDLRGLRDQRWWVLVLPLLFISPLALRLTYLNEHALAAALLWTGLALLNTALFRIAKEQATPRPAFVAGACLMLSAALVPLALAAIVGFGGVLLADRQAALRQLGRNLAIGAAPIAILTVMAHMWGFDKLLPLLALHQVQAGLAVQDVLTDLIGYNGLLWMFPPATVGLVILLTRIIRTQELEDAQAVDLFRAGQGAFHWGAYWTVLAAVGLAVVDGAFGYGVPHSAAGRQIGIILPFAGDRTQITWYLHHYAGDQWVVLTPLMIYYCAFIFREPILAAWKPWYHNAVRVGALCWLFGLAQPAGGIVCPLIEAAYRWSINVATYYPAGRLS